MEKIRKIGAVDGVGYRSPWMQRVSLVQTTMFIGIAFTEALAIFAIVVGFIVKFG